MRAFFCLVDFFRDALSSPVGEGGLVFPLISNFTSSCDDSESIEGDTDDDSESDIRLVVVWLVVIMNKFMDVCP